MLPNLPEKVLSVEILPIHFVYMCQKVAMMINLAQSVDMCKSQLGGDFM